MIKVLYKTFDVLEYVASRRGQAVLPQEIVKALDLNQSTCIRIMKDLAELGYLQQLGPRKGYVLGPIAFYLADGKRYKNSLFQAAEPEIEACARKIGQSVLLATRNGAWRHILCHYNYNANMQIDCSAPRYNDLYITASGRLLLAYAPDTELSDIVVCNGLPPQECWPAAAGSLHDLKQELEKIRTAGLVKWSQGMNQQLYVVAFPLFIHDVMIASVASSWPIADSHRITNECIKEVAATAKQIAGRLNENLTGG